MTGYRGLVDNGPVDSTGRGGPVGGEADAGEPDGTDSTNGDGPVDSTGGGEPVDSTGGGEPVDSGAEPPKDETPAGAAGFDRWRRRSVTGAVMTGIALGLQEVFTGPKPEIPIVHEAPGEPPAEDQAIALSFDPDQPHRAVAVIRPWLLGQGQETSVPSEDAPDQSSPGTP
ncbi:MAG: hypothetical protein ACYCX8_08440 [Acidimicrobiales bacterium]